MDEKNQLQDDLYQMIVRQKIMIADNHKWDLTEIELEQLYRAIGQHYINRLLKIDRSIFELRLLKAAT